MASIYRTREPARTALPSGWEWRMYGARHLASGICVCWAVQGGHWSVDGSSGLRARDLRHTSIDAAVAAVEGAWARKAA